MPRAVVRNEMLILEKHVMAFLREENGWLMYLDHFL